MIGRDVIAGLGLEGEGQGTILRRYKESKIIALFRLVRRFADWALAGGETTEDNHFDLLS